MAAVTGRLPRDARSSQNARPYGWSMSRRPPEKYLTPSGAMLAQPELSLPLMARGPLRLAAAGYSAC